MRRHESTQVPGRPFVVGAICFFIFMGAAYVGVGGLLKHWSRQPLSALALPAPPTADMRWNMQAPQVQIDPTIDLAKVRAMEDRRLHALRWTDGTQAYAAIPIDEAMKLLADAAAKNQINTVLPAPQPATPIDLQNQKSREVNPPVIPTP